MDRLRRKQRYHVVVEAVGDGQQQQQQCGLRSIRSPIFETQIVRAART